MKPEKTETRVPWKDRLALAEQGLLPDDGAAAEAVCRIRDLPLDAYLARDPELLDLLQALYTPSPRTFGEAAAVIDALGREPQYLDTAVSLMRRFAGPIRRSRL